MAEARSPKFGRLLVTFALIATLRIGADSPAHAAEPARAVDFNRDVRPILSRHCFACHGQDDAQRARGLRLDHLADATKELKSGARAIVPGEPDESELLARIVDEDETSRMPPKKSGDRLATAEVETLRRWIEQGATFAEHWSFTAPVARPLPAVKRADWPRNGVDAWILGRLEREGLAPSPEADRFALLRRLSLDLRGLPPTPAEVADFARDDAPDAYERAVDRLIQDPAFGERRARHWLDLARYADSSGFGSDPLRTIWRYRDWVIDAFNGNQPYNEFTIDQIAGDLRPAPTLSQTMATAFHRNTMTNTEGGTDDEEFRVAAVKDRVDTTLQVWMGLTMGCAKCHTHKYDPITHDDYYRTYAVFNQTQDNDQPNEAPTIPAPSPALLDRIRELDAKIGEQKAMLAARTPELAASQDRWERTLVLAEGAEPDPGSRVATPADVLAAADLAPADRSPAQVDRLFTYFRTIAPETKSIRGEIARLEASRPAVPTLPILAELPSATRRTTHLMVKGNHLDPGHKVEPGVPGAFHPLNPGDAADRMGLARWLVDSRNPLTARVEVNRIWGELFGAGLVETEEDFGTQGELPSHPELLDWLALELIGLDWDTKALIRTIVTSSTYRQSSKVNPELIARDPKNRLLARAPRYRLEAETVRDQALSLSGLLSRKMNGPSVFPYQPGGLWQAAFNGERTWATSDGEDRHRRGLYTFWRRTTPYPSMTAFDAPSRETCAIRRIRTNTPLQAFVTMNDPVYVEASQALARRMVREGGSDDRSRARFGLELCLGRPATDDQVDRIEQLYRGERDHYRSHSEDAKALATEPLGPLPEGMAADELAAWTTIANVLLNLDGVLTRG
ncbi:PSD1 and planctomycete cytochrome C domain-containing protein [Isosphaeraceae bacterium EP7]